MRQQFKIHPVHEQLDGSVGIVRVTSFARGSGAATTKAAVPRLRAEGATSLILDLRGNPGGLLDEAVKIASLFLRDGSTVVSLAGAHRPLRIVYAHNDLIVVVTARGARRRRKCERVRGRRRRTEGSRPGDDRRPADVRQVARRSRSTGCRPGAALKLTVARYLTPAGYDISRGGVQPDIRSRHALAAALQFFAGRRS